MMSFRLPPGEEQVVYQPGETTLFGKKQKGLSIYNGRNEVLWVSVLDSEGEMMIAIVNKRGSLEIDAMEERVHDATDTV